jgi:hypothetical protein
MTTRREVVALMFLPLIKIQSHGQPACISASAARSSAAIVSVHRVFTPDNARASRTKPHDQVASTLRGPGRSSVD